MTEMYMIVVLLSPVIMTVFWGCAVFAFGARSQQAVAVELVTTLICLLWLALIDQPYPHLDESANFAIYITVIIGAMSSWMSARRVINMMTYVSVRDGHSRGLADIISRLEAEIETMRAGEISKIITSQNTVYHMPSASWAASNFEQEAPRTGDIVFAKDESAAYLVSKHIELKKLKPGVIADIVCEPPVIK